LQVPPELEQIFVLSVMNPATILVGFLLGRRADQKQKIAVGAFGAGVAGTAFAGLLRSLGYTQLQPRLLAGVFVLSFVLGMVWAWIGFVTRRTT
jgi:hypothetical protein